METSSNTTPIIVERTYQAPVKAVWEALTDKAKMKQWYFDVSDFKAEPGFEFEFTGGTKEHSYLHKCVITEVILFKKLAHTWRYDGFEGSSVVTWELFDEGDNTRVKLTHTGLETFGADNPDFARHNFEAGWDYIVNTGLKTFVEAS